MVKSDVTQQIKEKLSILEVIGQYVELHKSGSSFKGKSPFTNEKTPSFFVSPDRGMYFCFSSQKGGDIFTFIQEMEGVDFKGALKILAEKAGIPLVREDPRQRDERDTLYATLEEATQFFFNAFDRSAEATNYLINRGVNKSSRHSWRIGYAPDEWRMLKTHLLGKGFSEEILLKAGLIKKSADGKESYDVFRNRIMFPLFDPSGRVLAFSGRALHNDDKTPKYVNSPETPLYHKSDLLYGYDKAKQGIRSYDFSLIVEGQFDLVLSHQAGYTNTVAVSGTAFTEHHLDLLLRLSHRSVLALDSDRAGLSGIKRCGTLMLKKGMDVKAVAMDDGEDPASLILKDKELYKKAIRNAEPLIEFFLKKIKMRAKDERAYKLSAREEIIPLLIAIPDRIDREHFEGVMSAALQTTKDAIHFESLRLEQEENTAPGITNEIKSVSLKSPLQHSTLTQTRKKALIEHLYALSLVTKTSYPDISSAIDEQFTICSLQNVKEILSQDATLQRALFIAEDYITAIRRRELYEEVGENLTELTKLIAKERIIALKKNLQLAEESGDDVKVAELLTAIHESQHHLYSSIVITDSAQQKG